MSPALPRVAIGMPTFNASTWVERAIESCLSQTYANLELTICDNASTDDTAEICERFASSPLKKQRTAEVA